MKKTLVLLVLFTLVLSLAVVTGCGKKTTTISTPEGDIKVTEGEGGEVTISGEGGDSTYNLSDQAPTEAQLGVAVYPGAAYVSGTGVSGSVTAEGEKSTMAGADFTTSDSMSKVVDWYTGKLGEPLYSTPEEVMWTPTLSTGSGDFVTVVVRVEGGKTKVSIARMSTSGQ